MLFWRPFPDIAFTAPLTIKVNMFLFNGTAAQCTPFISLVSVGFACWKKKRSWSILNSIWIIDLKIRMKYSRWLIIYWHNTTFLTCHDGSYTKIYKGKPLIVGIDFLVGTSLPETLTGRPLMPVTTYIWVSATYTVKWKEPNRPKKPNRPQFLEGRFGPCWGVLDNKSQNSFRWYRFGPSYFWNGHTKYHFGPSPQFGPSKVQIRRCRFGPKRGHHTLLLIEMKNKFLWFFFSNS